MSTTSSRQEKLHTSLFILLGLGILLTYGLATTSFSLPKWLFLLIAAAVAVAWSSVRLAVRRSVTLDRMDIALLAICVYATLGLLWTPDPAGGLTQVVSLAAITIVILYARHSRADALAFRIALLSVCATAIILLRSFLNPDINGGFGNENYLTETLLLCCPFLGLWFFMRTQPDRWAGPLLIVASLILLLFINSSRIEYLAIPTLGWATLLARILSRKGKKWASLYCLVSLTALCVFIWTCADLLLGIESVSERFEIYVNSVGLWLERPIFGWGPGGFDYGYPRFQQYHLTIFPDRELTALPSPFVVAGSAHNEIIQILVELGIPGALLIGWIFLTVASAALTGPSHPPLVLSASCAFVFLCVIAMTNFPMRNPATAALAAIVLGILSRPGLIPAGVITIDLPRVVRGSAVAGSMALLCGTFLATGSIYLSGQYFAVSQALRDRSPEAAFSHLQAAIEQFPQSLEYRRQLYVTYVDWVGKAEDRSKPLSLDHQRFFETGLNTGPQNPGLLLTRIRFLFLAGLSEKDRAEIERHLATLKKYAPLLREVHIAEGLFARETGDTDRAHRAISRAKELEQTIR